MSTTTTTATAQAITEASAEATRSPEAVAAMVLRALERRHLNARSWAPASALAAELRLDAAEVGRALARLGAEGRVERRVDWDRHGVTEQWRIRPADLPPWAEAEAPEAERQ